MHVSATDNRLSRLIALVRAIAPGLVVVGAITIGASYLGGLAPVVGAPVFAILIGIGIALVRTPHQSLDAGIKFASKKVLQGSIIVLGFGLSLRQVLHTGIESLPVLIGSLVSVLLIAWIVGKALHIPRDANLLIGVGTAICGASAIAATDAVIDADEADVSYAIATIFLFNVIAVLLYPSIGHALGLSQHSFGLWAGTAINDTSSVVAASNIYGRAAVAFAVVVKLTRTLAIIPICLGVAWWWNRRESEPGHAAARVPLKKIFPLFIVFFVAAVGINSTGVIPNGWHHPLANCATWMITAALGAIGLSTKPASIRRAGIRPILLGGILWASVGLISLGLQAATGTL